MLECEKCGHVYKHLKPTFYDVVCRKCGNKISKYFELPLVINNRNSLKNIKEKIRTRIGRRTSTNRNSDDMAIASNNTNVTYDFQWQCDEDPSLTLTVQYSIVNGKHSIKFSQNGDDWVELPASFFIEVAGFANGQKFNKPQMHPPAMQQNTYSSHRTPNNILKSESGSTAVITSDEPAPGSLPLPKIHRKVTEEGILEPMEVADIRPLQNLSQIDSILPPEKVVKSTRKKSEVIPEEAYNRPVIRAADEESSRMMRGGPSGNAKVRPRHG